MKNVTQVQKEQKSEQKVESTPVYRYRYACHGCTNDAMVSTNAMVGVVITCMHCGKAQIAEPQNWLPL